MRKLNYLIILGITLLCISLVSSQTCINGIYPCDSSIPVINSNPIVSTSSSNSSLYNVNNSLYWQSHTGTDGSWLTGIIGSSQMNDSYVPYNGATQDVNLNGKQLTNISNIQTDLWSSKSSNTYIKFTNSALHPFNTILDLGDNLDPDDASFWRSLYLTDNIWIGGTSYIPKILINGTSGNVSGINNICYSNGTNCQVSSGMNYTNIHLTNRSNTDNGNQNIIGLVNTSTGYKQNNLDLIKNSFAVSDIKNSSPYQNVFIGEYGNSSASGNTNYCFGSYACQQLTSGKENIAIGYLALNNASDSNNSIAIGFNAGSSGQGNNNFFVGNNAGQNTKSSNNVFFGNQAGYGNTNGAALTCIGNYAGYGLGAGNSDNIFIGYYAGGLNAVGSGVNTVIGNYAGQSILAGNANTYIGYYAGQAASGYYNTIIGEFAGDNANTQWENTIVGQAAGTNLQNPVTYAGGQNTLIGSNSGGGLTTGTKNIFLGWASGYRQTTTSNNLIIDSVLRGNSSNETTQSIIVGQMNINPSNQNLTFNANTKVNGDLNVTGIVNAQTNFSINNIQGLTFNYTTVCFVDLVGLTKKTQNFTVIGGIIVSNSSCS